MFKYIILKFYLAKRRERRKIKIILKRSLINSKNVKHYRISVLKDKFEQKYFILIKESREKVFKRFRISY